MCLSIVYVLGNGEKEQIARNVAEVKVRDGRLYFTDTVRSHSAISVLDLASGTVGRLTDREMNITGLDFYEDGFSIINPIVVDQKGRVYITSWYSDDIFSKFYFDLSLDEGGCRFVAMDDGSEVCAWLKNDIVYVSYPVTLGVIS